VYDAFRTVGQPPIGAGHSPLTLPTVIFFPACLLTV
jgi:hypothetical protein